MSENDQGDEVGPAAVIHVTFDHRGNMAYELQGVRPHQLWAAARLLENMGDHGWLASQNARAMTGPHLVVPEPSGRRVKLT